MEQNAISFNRYFQIGLQAPSGVPSPAVLIRELRKRLRMTQSQLAKRAGLPQSHIAKIESNKVDLRLSTIQKIFHALRGQPVLLLKPEEEVNHLLAAQAKVAARRRIDRLVGSMSLEKQRPDPGTLEQLLKEEEAHLLRHPASEIWDE
jgi:transcriptional regulator with XRE-family HTH domain